MKYVKLMLLVAVMAVCVAGCRKPPLVEKFDEVKNNETAFVIQLEGGSQAKLDSLEALQKMQVSSKRIDIPQRFQKTGRYGWQGKWIPTIKIIKVDRSPVTREWSSDTTTGTSAKDQGIWVESMDSIGFSTGFNCTAMVTEPDSAQFLYLYPGGSLSRVMDDQIRNDIQSVASEAAAIYPLDECRTRKLEIIKAVRETVIPKYAKTGITITTIGMFGGFEYEEAEIQTAINKTFIAQQDKVVAAAEYEAQEDRNRTIEKAAVGIKNAAVTKAEGASQSAIIKAEGEARAIELVALAAEQANSNPVFLELKKLEVEIERLKIWDGAYPKMYMGQGTDMMMMMPAPQ
jgi:regulator of protease activity HflC (stomatin/prohibitin superfamily)